MSKFQAHFVENLFKFVQTLFFPPMNVQPDVTLQDMFMDVFRMQTVLAKLNAFEEDIIDMSGFCGSLEDHKFGAAV